MTHSLQHSTCSPVIFIQTYNKLPSSETCTLTELYSNLRYQQMLQIPKSKISLLYTNKLNNSFDIDHPGT